MYLRTLRLCLFSQPIFLCYSECVISVDLSNVWCFFPVSSTSTVNPICELFYFVHVIPQILSFLGRLLSSFHLSESYVCLIITSRFLVILHGRVGRIWVYYGRVWKKIHVNIQMEEVHRWGLWEGVGASMTFPGASLSQFHHEFTSLEVLWNWYFWDFYGGFLT